MKVSYTSYSIVCSQKEGEYLLFISIPFSLHILDQNI